MKEMKSQEAEEKAPAVKILQVEEILPDLPKHGHGRETGKEESAPVEKSKEQVSEKAPVSEKTVIQNSEEAAVQDSEEAAAQASEKTAVQDSKAAADQDAENGAVQDLEKTGAQEPEKENGPEHDPEYEARRERRRQLIKKRKRKKRNQKILLTVLLLLLAGGAAVYFTGCWKQIPVWFTQLQNTISDKQASGSTTEEESVQTAEMTEETAAQVEDSNVVAEEEEVVTPELTDSEDETLTDSEKKALRKAKKYARQYDYTNAVKILKAEPTYKENKKLRKSARYYKKLKDSCVSWSLEEVTHVFYHSLIVDTSKAFDGDYKEGDYDQVMTTIEEFNKITQTMYDKGYVMVSVYDMVTANEDGTVTRGEILLPPGKIPFVLSQDDVCYYHYMDGDGFASKLVVDEDGKVRNEYVEDDGSISVGDYDMVPLIDRFVEEHPDFSYRGAKGIVALTGYNGILGYRTDSSYETRPDDLDADKVKWLDEHPDFSLEEERQGAQKVAQAMKEEGWLFASHTWGHQDVAKITLEHLQSDTQKFKDNVDPIIGGTDIIIFAFGTDLTQSEDYYGDKFEYLKSQGYNYFCNVDSRQYSVEIRDNYFRQGRRNLDGYRMYYQPELLEDLFNVKDVFDSARPVPVPQMS